MMSSETATTSTAGPRRRPAVRHRHPNYVLVAIILFVVTAMEVAAAIIWREYDTFVVPILFILMLMKAAGVAGYYMHLRFDSRVFTLLAMGPFLIGIGLTLVFFTFFGGWPG